GWADRSSPYPVGANLTWHNGIHVRASMASSADVYTLLPGEIVAVRSSKSQGEEFGTGFVLVRHCLDVAHRAVMHTGQWSSTSEPGRDPAKYPYFYSLYIHLQSFAEVISADKTAKPEAPSWLRRIAPVPVPNPQKYLPAGRRYKLATWGKDGATL